METSRFPYGSVILIALALVCVLSVGCHHQPPVKVAKTVCRGDHTDCSVKLINVDPQNGVDKPEVCVCGGDTVTWRDNGHQFKVEFKNGSPFDDTVFHNGHPGGVAKDFAHQTIFKYEITVDGTQHDPRIVGGGGHP